MKIDISDTFAIFENREFRFDVPYSSRNGVLESNDPLDANLNFQLVREEEYGPTGMYFPPHYERELTDEEGDRLPLIYQKMTYAFFRGTKLKAGRIIGDEVTLSFGSGDEKYAKAYENDSDCIDVRAWPDKYGLVFYSMEVKLAKIDGMIQLWRPFNMDLWRKNRKLRLLSEETDFLGFKWGGVFL